MQSQTVAISNFESLANLSALGDLELEFSSNNCSLDCAGDIYQGAGYFCFLFFRYTFSHIEPQRTKHFALPRYLHCSAWTNNTTRAQSSDFCFATSVSHLKSFLGAIRYPSTSNDPLKWLTRFDFLDNFKVRW